MKKKYLPFYYECLETGRLPHNGLCTSLGGVELFRPFQSDVNSDENSWYWGYDGTRFTEYYDNAQNVRRQYEFTPLRQNIVLFLAVMHNEL